MRGMGERGGREGEDLFVRYSGCLIQNLHIL